MNLVNHLLAIRLLVIPGIINLLTGALIFFSCRCLTGIRLGKSLDEVSAISAIL